MEKEYSDKTAKQVRDQTAKIFSEFKQSPQFSKMFKYCQKEAEYVVEELGEFLYGYELVEPEAWSIDQFVGQAYNIQRKCMYSNNFFKALPKVIYHFSLFCEKNSIGSFSKERIEEFWQELKEGYYEDIFHSSWDEGFEVRQRFYKSWFG